MKESHENIYIEGKAYEPTNEIFGTYNTGLDKKKKQKKKKKHFQHKFVNIFLPIFLAYVLGAQKNRLIEMVLLSTHNIYFGWEIRKSFFCYALLTKVLLYHDGNTGHLAALDSSTRNRLLAKPVHAWTMEEIFILPQTEILFDFMAHS